MAKGDILGHIECSCCDFKAVVKEAKNGKPYAFCENCNVQIFTRYEHQSAGMLKKMKPIQKAVESVLKPLPDAKPAFDLGNL